MILGLELGAGSVVNGGVIQEEIAMRERDAKLKEIALVQQKPQGGKANTTGVNH
jgi:hypothetical protein